MFTAVTGVIGCIGGSKVGSMDSLDMTHARLHPWGRRGHYRTAPSARVLRTEQQRLTVVLSKPVRLHLQDGMQDRLLERHFPFPETFFLARFLQVGSQISRRVHVRVNASLFLYVPPVMSWPIVQGGTHHSPKGDMLRRSQRIK